MKKELMARNGYPLVILAKIVTIYLAQLNRLRPFGP
jgi:hypothetical protein